MNEQLQTALTEILNTTLDATKAGANFLQAELPEVIEQLLLWKLLYHGAVALFAVVLAGAVITLAGKYVKYVASLPPGDRDDWIFGGVMASIFLVTPFLAISLILFNLKWLQIWVAPKIYLIEYAARLVK